MDLVKNITEYIKKKSNPSICWIFWSDNRICMPCLNEISDKISDVPLVQYY